MIHWIAERNVHGVITNACWTLTTSGVREPTRVGMVLTLPAPAIVEYKRPMERVLLWPERRINPFFHLFEALWMLAGRRDVPYVEQFNSRMREFSDDGSIFNGAYGYRWREHFGVDQIEVVIRLLKKDPLTRRAVITMWDPRTDCGVDSKDLPCNTQIYFRLAQDRLNMTVTNRSNDLIWGMCGTNVVHFSMLHELVAHGTGHLLGSYYHMTNNLHIYENVPKRHLYERPFVEDYYTLPHSRGGVEAMPMITTSWEKWLADCRAFVENDRPELLRYNDSWFQAVAVPMWLAWKEKSPRPLDLCIAEDWRAAGRQYLAGLSA